MIIKHNIPIASDTEKCEIGPQAALVIKVASIGSFIDLPKTADLRYGGGGRLYVREVPEVEKVCGRESRPEEFHPEALAEPDRTLSRHPAPIMEPRYMPTPSGQTALDNDARCSRSSA
jgi:hypothetical protein